MLLFIKCVHMLLIVGVFCVHGCWCSSSSLINNWSMLLVFFVLWLLVFILLVDEQLRYVVGVHCVVTHVQHVVVASGHHVVVEVHHSLLVFIFFSDKKLKCRNYCWLLVFIMLLLKFIVLLVIGACCVVVSVLVLLIFIMSIYFFKF
jgi:hypothetical protein